MVCLLPAAGFMCKHVFGTPRALPCGLYEIIPDFEGQKRVYTDIYRLFDLTLREVFGQKRVRVFNQ